ncbi:Uncharacterised protein (plasmid) [Tsukamurella tyrosinosolvens]|uniref:Uncharacterized protein n=1 Tax=Tsukamurella tyrosinosolvens TaxID=57704 RepID=A0A1H4SKA3_TSUTY|nr:hypothetical protein SAMN04489793_2304 [Tsukamurella tyrosinosolvens]VEH96468.1 Uncharacterised protein [Tsukamurella tyrosinosolvens]
MRSAEAASSSSAARVTPTALSESAVGVTRVTTETGKTTCNVYVDRVECQSGAFGKNYRAPSGEPANGFVYRGGRVNWTYGNMAVTWPATVIHYGNTYSAFGWTIEASSRMTVFGREGHGVIVDVTKTSTF